MPPAESTVKIRVTAIDDFNCMFKKQVLKGHELYCHLHASDTWPFPKRSIDNVAVLSSTIHTALGSGCIPVVRESNFLYGVKDAVLSYRDEFEAGLRETFRQRGEWKRARGVAKEFVQTLKVQR